MTNDEKSNWQRHAMLEQVTHFHFLRHSSFVI